MSYTKNLLIAIDQLVNALFGGHCDETISAWAHRTHRKRTESFINWLFNDPMHCAKAYVSEMEHTQNDPIYRKE